MSPQSNQRKCFYSRGGTSGSGSYSTLTNNNTPRGHDQEKKNGNIRRCKL